MKYTIKQIIIYILIIIIIGAIFLSIKYRKVEPQPENNVPIADNSVKEPISMCYYRATKTARGFYDTAWLKLNTTEDKINGEFRNLPAEKDSKIGMFDGTVGPVDKQSMSRRANVWWDSQAEGMQTKEELIIDFGEGSATVGFGEMVDRGDGVYVYKDKTKLNYIDSMSQIDCQTLDERLFVEKYVRDNITTIATNKAVVGGTWYVISVKIDPVGDTGEVIYEDGHIQSKANLTYTYQENPESVSVTKWIIIK